MKTNNPVLKSAGYAPVADLLEVLGMKARSTLHRLIQANPKIKTIEDGGGREQRALYIHLESLRDFYKDQKNAPMADRVEELRKRYAKTYKAA